MINIIKNKAFYLVVYGAIFFALIIYIQTPYIGDDILNSMARGEAIKKGYSFAELVQYYIVYSTQIGRTYYLVLLVTYATFYLFTNRIAYKLFIIFLSILALVFGERFFSLHFKSTYAGKVFLLASSAVVPFYYCGSNSYAMYFGFMQYEVIILFSLLILVDKYIEEKKKKYLIIAGLILFLSFFLYEISILFIIPITFVIVSNKGKAAIKLSLPYWMISIVGIFTIIMVRIISTIVFPGKNYDGITFSFDFLRMVKTFFIQFLGGVSFYNLTMAFVKTRYVGANSILNNSIVIALVFLIAIIGVYWRLIKKNTENEVASKGIEMLIIAFGLLWLGIAGMISFSSKYQNELPVSLCPHIPAYVESVCCASICTCIYLKFEKKISHKKFLAFIMVIISATNVMISNYAVGNIIDETKGLYIDMPDVYKQAINSGLFDEVGESDLVVIDINYSPTIYPNYFSMIANRTINSERYDIFMQNYNESYFNGNLYITKCFQSDEQKVVYLDKIESITVDENNNPIITISSIKAWVKTETPIDSLTLLKNDGTAIVSEISDSEKVSAKESINIIVGDEYNYSSYAFFNIIEE